MLRGCRLLGVSTQAVYQARKRDTVQEQQLRKVKDWVVEYRRIMPRIGGRKLYALLQAKLISHSIKLGRDGFFRYLKQQRLLVTPKKNYTKTTQSKHWLKKHANLLKDVDKPVVPEQVLVSDITYVKSKQGTHYLSLVTDACSRKIVGYHLSNTMMANDVVKALHMATKNKYYHNQCIHHSDRGLQYASDVYQKALQQYGIVPSMTDGYDCYQNALAERINGILKSEFLLYTCNTFDELKTLITESIYIYNTLRPHLSLNMKTPNQVHYSYS